MPENKKPLSEDKKEKLHKYFNVKNEEESEKLNEFIIGKQNSDEQKELERDNELISKVFTGGLQGLVTSVMNSVAGLFRDLAPIDKKLLKIFFNFCEERKLIPTRIIESLLEYFMEQYGNSIKLADDGIYDDDGTLWLPEDVQEPEEPKPFRISGLTKEEVGKYDDVEENNEKDAEFIWFSDT